MSYAQTLQEHARLTILRMLEDAPSYTLNVLIMTQLMRSYGINYSRDQVTGEVHWLKEQGLVNVEDMKGFIVVEATARGVEVAQGIAQYPGVQRPRPGV
ncbi:MAG: hypothetical protein VX378_11670 [Pseudomonadota bacterium]|nr:hypothetical protein [Pseudomonadota bacterium]